MGRTLTKLKKELSGDTRHSVVVTIITDGYENSSTEYSLVAVRALIEHLKGEGWSFAYMGTDHDVHSVTVGLSITNVIQFQKTEAQTREVFRKERQARERNSRKMREFDLASPEATYEERANFQASLAKEYYDEDK